MFVYYCITCVIFPLVAPDGVVHLNHGLLVGVHPLAHEAALHQLARGGGEPVVEAVERGAQVGSGHPRHQTSRRRQQHTRGREHCEKYLV